MPLRCKEPAPLCAGRLEAVQSSLWHAAASFRAALDVLLPDSTGPAGRDPHCTRSAATSLADEYSVELFQFTLPTSRARWLASAPITARNSGSCSVDTAALSSSFSAHQRNSLLAIGADRLDLPTPCVARTGKLPQSLLH